MEEENDLQDLEELTEEEQVTQPNEVSIEEPPIVFSSMLEAIQLTINAPLFYFTISEQQSRPVTQGAGIGMFAPATVITDQRFYTLGDVLTGNVYVKHIPREFNDRFKKLVTNPGEDAQTELVSLLEDVGRHLQDNDAKQTVELGEGNTKSTLIVEFDKDKTMEGNVNLATGGAESINVSEYADVIEQLDFVKINKERKY